MTKRKGIPLTADGRLWLRTGRLTKQEENELYAKMDRIVGFTRPKPAAAEGGTPRPDEQSSDDATGKSEG